MARCASARPHALAVTKRNAAFQQWQALLTSRTKRHRTGQFLVQGVRPIEMALRYGWPVDALLYRAGQRSSWADDIVHGATSAARYELAPELLSELGEKEEQPPELLLVAEIPPDDLNRLPVPRDALLVIMDRPASPGNLGTVIRSADALGACGVIVTGHATDPYDPRTVRATTGSLFAVPTVRVSAGEAVLDWIRATREPLRVLGMAEDAPAELADVDLTGPTAIVVGNETHGMSAFWLGACDVLARIPMGGSASSLNAAVSGSIALYEAARQRRPIH